MPVRLVISHNLSELPIFLTNLTEGPVKRAVARSIKRTLQGLRAETTKTIRDRKLVDTRKLSVAEIKRRFIRETDQTSSSLSIPQMQASLSLNDIRISLKYFFARKIRAGRSKLTGAPLYAVQATVFGKTFKAGRAFMGNDNSVVFARVGKSRLPIRKLFGPSLRILAEKTGLISELQKYAQTRYETELSSNLDFFLKDKK